MATNPILFLSGAGVPAWIWDEVRGGLQVRSHVAAYPRRPRAALGDYAADALAQIPGGEFTIVAHSIGGVVAGQILAVAPTRVRAILGVAASFPTAGTSFVDALPLPQRLLVGLAMRVAGTRPPDKAIRAGLCAGLEPDDVARIVAEFEPESPRLYRDKVSSRTFPAHNGYVVTTADPEMSVSQQRAHAGRLGSGLRRELPTGHLPMLQDPAALTKVIGEFLAPSYDGDTAAGTPSSSPDGAPQ